jgi:hypothetical protein
MLGNNNNNNSNMEPVLDEHFRHCLLYEFNMGSRPAGTAHKHMTKVYGQLAPTEKQCEHFFFIQEGEQIINRFTFMYSDIGIKLFKCGFLYCCLATPI